MTKKELVQELLSEIPAKVGAGARAPQWEEKEEQEFIQIVEEMIAHKRTVKDTLDLLAAKQIFKGKAKTALYKKWQEHSRQKRGA